MTVARLVGTLRAGGFDLDADQILDALWLATLGRDLTCGTAMPPRLVRPVGGTGEGTGGGERGRGGAAETPEQKRQEPHEDPPTAERGADGPSPVYGHGDVSAEDVTIPATGIILPSARALTDRLPLIRALRPLRRRFPSHTTELDEERTAELTAELRGVAGDGVFPVLRSRRERWFEAHLVVEDDPAIELWSAPLREFGQLLADAGAFRLVRSWRLRLDPAAPDGIAGARLESPAGGLSSPGALGRTRQLIFFASHGRSLHWGNGVYARLLASWPASNVVLLHLQPHSRWGRTVLGEPQALARSLQPGARNAELAVEPFWWRLGPDPDAPGVLRLPATPIEPQSLELWARTLMGLGRQTETFLLDPAEAGADLPTAAPVMRDGDIDRTLATLQERSAAAYDLAMMLASAPFTLPVARLVQEVVQNGGTDFTVLADLMLSGIVVPRGAAPTRARETTYFEIREDARPSLLRGLRGADADALARSLDARISRHLSDIAGRSIQFSALIAHPDGPARLPVWAQEFAHIVTALTDRPASTQTQGTWRTLLDTLPPGVVGRMARLASLAVTLTAETVDERLWRHVDDPRLICVSETGGHRFRRTVAEELQRRLAAEPYLGLTILWVDDLPENNTRIADELRAGTAEVILALDTETALAEPRLAGCDLVISDMARGSDGRAGFDLIAELRVSHPSLPVVIFAGHAMTNPARRRAVMAAGAFGGTNRPDELIDLVRGAALASVLRKGSAERRRREAQWSEADDPVERTIALIPEGQFCTLDEIHQAIAADDRPFAGDRIMGALLFFENARQRSWLVATENWLLLLLDEPATRRDGRLVQQHVRPDGDAVAAWIDTQGIPLLRLGRDATPWYYSAALFEEPAYLVMAVRKLIGKATARPTGADAPWPRDAARAALLAIDIDCTDWVVLEIIVAAARLRPERAHDRGISLSRVFCGAEAMAAQLRDPDGSAEPLLHAFGLTLDRVPWQDTVRDLRAKFERDDVAEALLRLQRGFSEHARAVLLRAAEGGLRAASLVEVLLDPDERSAESVLYRRIPSIAALRADVYARHAGVAKEPAAPRTAVSDASAVARAVNGQVHDALGYWTGIPTMPPIVPGMVGTMRDGEFVPLVGNAAVEEFMHLPSDRSEIADILHMTKRAVQVRRQKHDIRVVFTERYAMLLHLRDCSLLRSPHGFLESMVLELVRQKRWDRNWRVVTDVVRARSTTVLVARSADAGADFVARRRSDDVHEMLTDAQLLRSRDMAFRIADARDLTPLYRLAKVRSNPLRKAALVAA